MSSFGENLRREREMRGVTLEEISAATKISVRFLECVESENFSKLPGGIFTRSFIRSYGRYLGLDEEALLAEYQQAVGNQEEPDISRLPGLRPYPTEQKSSRLAQFVVPIIAVLLGAVGYAVWRHARPGPLPLPPAAGLAEAPKITARAGPANPPTAVPAPANPAPIAAGNGTSGALPWPAATVAPPNTGPGTPAAAFPSQSVVSGESGLNLQIAATERSWVTVTADGQTIFQGVLRPDDVKIFHAANAIDVLTGNAQGIILTLNGQTLKPLGQEGEVKSVHLTRATLSQPAP